MMTAHRVINRIYLIRKGAPLVVHSVSCDMERKNCKYFRAAICSGKDSISEQHFWRRGDGARDDGVVPGEQRNLKLLLQKDPQVPAAMQTVTIF